MIHLILGLLILGFYPQPDVYLGDRLGLLKTHGQNAKAVHLNSSAGSTRVDASSPGVLGAWLSLLAPRPKVKLIAMACERPLEGTVKPRLEDRRVLMELGTSGWVLEQDLGLPTILRCGDETLYLADYGQGGLPQLYPSRLILERGGQRSLFTVQKIEF